MLVSSSVEKLSLQMESEGEKEVREAGWRWWGAGQGEEYEEELGREGGESGVPGRANLLPTPSPTTSTLYWVPRELPRPGPRPEKLSV